MRQIADLHEVFELLAHDQVTAHHPPQRALVQDDPQPQRTVGVIDPVLAAHPHLNAFLKLLLRQLGDVPGMTASA